MFLYRKEVYFPDDPEFKGRAELILAKHRNGKIGTVGLQFTASQTRFHDLAKEDRYQPGSVPPPGRAVEIDKVVKVVHVIKEKERAEVLSDEELMKFPPDD